MPPEWIKEADIDKQVIDVRDREEESKLYSRNHEESEERH